MNLYLLINTHFKFKILTIYKTEKSHFFFIENIFFFTFYSFFFLSFFFVVAVHSFTLLMQTTKEAFLCASCIRIECICICRIWCIHSVYLCSAIKIKQKKKKILFLWGVRMPAAHCTEQQQQPSPTNWMEESAKSKWKINNKGT